MIPILVILLLILINGVFVMAEMAVVSSRKPRLQQWANEGSIGAQIALDLSSNPDRFLSTIQIGITLIGILNGAFGENALTSRLAVYFEGDPTIGPYAGSIAFVIVVIAITYATLIFGELVPKRLALHSPERIASAMSGAMLFLSRVGSPAVKFIGGSTRVVLSLLWIRPPEEPPVTQEEISVMM